MSAKPTLAVLTPRFPHPIEKGDKLRMFHQLRALSQEFHVHLVALSDQKINPKSLLAIQEIVSETTIIYQSKNRLVKAGIKSIFGSQPIQVNYYSESIVERKVKEAIEKIAPDVIYVQLVRIAHMVRFFKGPKAIDYMDAMSLNMKREASFRSVFTRFIFGLEAQRILKVEQSANVLFDEKFIISKPDKDYLNEKGVEGLEVISNGVDFSYFSPESSPKTEEKYDLAFIGNMGYLPNILAAEFLVNEIVKKSTSTHKVLIAGARPHKRVKRLASDQVEISGWVDDIRDAYNSAKIIVAPIFSGAGQQNKILEAMALGKICITSPQVNKAIRAKEDEEIYIARNTEGFINTINHLLNNPDLCVEKGKNARNFVVNNFEWKTSGNLLNKKLLELLK